MFVPNIFVSYSLSSTHVTTDIADGIEVEGVAGRLIIVRCAALIPPLIPLCLRRSTSCYRRLSLSPMLPSSNTVSS